MPEIPSDQEKQSGEIIPEMLEAIPNGTIFSYNLDDTETPGGLKVRWKIGIAAGDEATRWETRQAEAIREILTWLNEHPPTP